MEYRSNSKGSSACLLGTNEKAGKINQNTEYKHDDHWIILQTLFLCTSDLNYLTKRILKGNSTHFMQ